MTHRDEDIRAVALLDEPVRRSLYDWAIGTGRAVSRDEAAAAIGIGRALAAFHLDRLVAGGLLIAEYRRLSGRTGPGAGRPTKLYRRAPREVTVSLPERRYEAAARMFAGALERMSDGPPPDALMATSRDAGRVVGAEARAKAGPRAGRRRLRAALVDTLRDRGYEPLEAADGDIRLANCPFDALVDDHRQLVCGMNLALADGVLDGLGDRTLGARLDEQPGLCCVAIRRATPTALGYRRAPAG